MDWRSVGITLMIAFAVGCGDGATEPASSDDDGGSTSTGGSLPSTDGGSDGASGGPICEGEGGWTAGGDGSGTGTGDSSGDPPTGMDDDMPLVTVIPDVQQGLIVPSTPVLIEDVVVISRPVPVETQPGHDLFVQQPEGGPWSGLRVRVPDGDPAMTLEVGDAVDVIGRVAENEGYYIVQISSSVLSHGVARVGAGVVPAPELIPVDELLVGDAGGRPYEGIGVRVEQVMVTDDHPCDGEFIIEDTVRVDDRFAPGQIEAPAVGSMLAAVEGVLIFAEDAMEIAPLDPAGVR